MTKCFAGDTQSHLRLWWSSQIVKIFICSAACTFPWPVLFKRPLLAKGFWHFRWHFPFLGTLLAVLPSACTARAPQRPRGFFGPSSACPDLLGWWVKYLGGRFCIIPVSCKGMIIFSLQHSLKCLLSFSRSLQECFSSLPEGHSKLFLYTTL